MRLNVRVMMPLLLVGVSSLVCAALPPPQASARDLPRRSSTNELVAAHRVLVPLGRTRANHAVDITLFLVQPHAAELQQYVAEQRRATMPISLSAHEIGERFGLSDDRLRQLVSQLDAAGIHVIERFDQRTMLVAQGSARSVERLFRVRLQEYRASDGSVVRIPSRQPRIPANLADAVSDVEGLDTRPAYSPRTTPRQTGAREGGWLTPTLINQIYGGGALRKAGWTGEGETVAVASLATAHGEEFSTWAHKFDTTTEPTAEIGVRPLAPTPGQEGWSAVGAGEVDLDLQMVRAMAPRATVLNYITKNDGGGLERIVNQVAQDRRASILTISWAFCEDEYDARELSNREGTYASAAAMGVDIFAASGDFGPYACNSWEDMSDRRLSVDYPASSGNVVAVGGTTLFFESSKAFEEGWQEPQSIVGSGGGVSQFRSRPAWQLDGVVAQPGTKRVLPDVAGPASDFSNLLVADWGPDGVRYRVAGGTSAAAPFWAGAMAVVKQYLRRQVGQFPDGKVATILYQIGSRPAAYAAAFDDVATGGSTVYSASNGWDFVTGIGTPNISGLALQWQALLTGG